MPDQNPKTNPDDEQPARASAFTGFKLSSKETTTIRSAKAHSSEEDAADGFALDITFYREQYSDLVDLSDEELRLHWRTFGHAEHRIPSFEAWLAEHDISPADIPADFIASEYATLNADVPRDSRFGPLQHYLLYGRKLGQPYRMSAQVHRTPNSSVRGAVDCIGNNQIAGWFALTNDETQPLTCVVTLDGQLIGYAVADEFRQDLLDAGIGTGRNSFGFVPLTKFSPMALYERGQLHIAGESHSIQRFVDPNVVSSIQESETLEADPVIEHNELEPDGCALLFFWPDNREHNCYLDAIYSASGDQIEVHSGDLNAAIAAAQYTNRQVIFHLHWVTPIAGDKPNRESAFASIDLYVGRLRHLISLGGEVVWTVHNLYCHDHERRELELYSSRHIAKLASTIFVHHESAIEEVCEIYGVNAGKVAVVPHPSYAGFYPNYTDRAQVRRRLGLGTDSTVFGFIGQLRPYKGIDELVEAFLHLSQHHRNIELVIAGRKVHPFDVQALKNIVDCTPNIHLFEGHIPDEQLQLYFNALDLCVLPYRQILTSGSTLCSATFAVPVLGPDVPGIREIVEHGKSGLLFSPHKTSKGRIESLVHEMDAYIQLPPGDRESMAESISARVDSFHPLTVSQNLFDTLLDTENSQSTKDGRYGKATYKYRMVEPTSPPRVVAVVLNYDLTEKTINAVRSLSSMVDSSECHVLVVDNATPDLSWEQLSKNFDQVSLIQTSTNVGYAGGNNIGARHAIHHFGTSLEYVWIVNPDIEVEADGYTALRAAAERHPDAGLFGSIIVDSRTPNSVAFGGRSVNLDNWRRLFVEHYKNESLEFLNADPYVVDTVSGASMMARVEAFDKVGDIPEQYFLYFEETDWCLRTKENGYRVMMVPGSVAVHHKESEVGDIPQPYYAYYYVRGYLLFCKSFLSSVPSSNLLELLTNEFLDPWRSKVGARNPEYLQILNNLFDAAVRDGTEGVVGPVDLHAVMNIPADNLALGQYGYVERCEGRRLVGWVTQLAQPWKTVEMVAVIDDKYFVDAEEVGIRQGGEDVIMHNGHATHLRRVEFELPTSVCDGLQHTVQFYFGDSWQPAPAAFGDFRAEVYRPAFEGRIEGLNGLYINGWAWDKNNPKMPLNLLVKVNGKVIDTVVADRYRGDLEKVNKRNGHCAFSVVMPFNLIRLGKANVELVDSQSGRSVAVREIWWNVSQNIVKETKESTDFLGWLASNIEVYRADNEAFDYLTKHTEAWKSVFLSDLTDSTSVISVIMPVYNRQDEVIRSIESVIGQSYENWELLVVDDGSTDGSVAEVHAFLSDSPDDRIKLLPQRVNRGVSAARNVGLQAASGEFIAYLDSDNEWDVDYLKVIVGALSASDAECAYAGQLVLQQRNRDGMPQLEMICARSAPFIRSVIENRNYIDLNVFAHSRKAYERWGGFNQRMTRLVDWELILRYTAYSQPIFIPALLSHYIVGRADNQITATVEYDKNLAEIEKTLDRISRDELLLLDSNGDKECPVILLYERKGSIQDQLRAHLRARIGYGNNYVFYHVISGDVAAFEDTLKSETHGFDRDVVIDADDLGRRNVELFPDCPYFIISDPWHAPRKGALIEAFDILDSEDGVGVVVGPRLVKGRTRITGYERGFMTSPLEFDGSITEVLKFHGKVKSDGRVVCSAVVGSCAIVKGNMRKAFLAEMHRLAGGSRDGVRVFRPFFAASALLYEQTIEYSPKVKFDDMKSW